MEETEIRFGALEGNLGDRVPEKKELLIYRKGTLETLIGIP